MLLRSFRYFALISALALPMVGPSEARDCELHEAVTQAASPDGAWIAVFYDNVCGGFIVTATSATVELMRSTDSRADDPIDARTVFGMGDLVGKRKVALTWTGPRNLEITIPNDASIGTKRTRLADVTISYKYEPDDAVARACLAYVRFLPIEDVQKLGPDFLDKCHAEGGPPRTSPR